MVPHSDEGRDSSTVEIVSQTWRTQTRGFENICLGIPRSGISRLSWETDRHIWAPASREGVWLQDSHISDKCFGLMCQSPSEGECENDSLLPCTWGEEGSRSASGARNIWYRVQVPWWYMCIQTAASLQGCCCCCPARTQQPRAISLAEPPLPMHTQGPENTQDLMKDLGSTHQGETTAASRCNPLCWYHLALSKERRATYQPVSWQGLASAVARPGETAIQHFHILMTTCFGV